MRQLCSSSAPWQGKPYKDKVTIFSLPEDFENSTNPLLRVDGSTLLSARTAKPAKLQLGADGNSSQVPQELEEMCCITIMSINTNVI